jgi:glycosyltransferase involved in cell wall biosynthesis
MKASIIIPTHNRANTLDRCLKSLTQQTMPSDAFEVLVIDNGSIDQTFDTVQHYAPSLKLTYVKSPEPGLHVARHEGMRQAKSDLLLFADDDIEAEPSWVDAVINTFENSHVALVGGNNYPLFEKVPPSWLAHWWQKPVYKGRALGSLSILDFGEGIFDIDPGYVWGCNYSIKREFLLKAGGFHPDGVPKELLRFRGDGETHVSDYVRSKGLRAVFNSRASIRHFVPASRMTRSYLEKRAFAQGISDSYTTVRKYGGLKLSFVIKARIAAKLITSFTKSILTFFYFSGSPLNKKLQEVQTAMLSAYRRGYLFHQNELRTDPALLSWVMKEKYF